MPTPVGGGPPHTVPGSLLQVSENGTCGSGCLPVGQGGALLPHRGARPHGAGSRARRPHLKPVPELDALLPAEAPSPLKEEVLAFGFPTPSASGKLGSPIEERGRGCRGPPFDPVSG